MPAPTARRAMGPQRRALLCAFVALLLVYAGYAVWRASAWRADGRKPVKQAHAQGPSALPKHVPEDRRNQLLNAPPEQNLIINEETGNMPSSIQIPKSANTISNNMLQSANNQDNAILKMALNLQKNDSCQNTIGWVPLMIVNTAFISMLNNWILLVQKNLAVESQSIIDCVIFVGTELNVVQTLRVDFNVPWTYHWTNSVAVDDEMKYGSEIYFKLMSDRLQFVEGLLKHGVSIGLIEADQVFLKNPFNVINRLENEKRHDIITYDEGNAQPCFGFLFIRPTQEVLRIWSRLITIMQKNPQNEQVLMQRILKNAAGVSVRYLPSTQFQSGLAFKQKIPGIDTRLLVFVHANFVVGITEKVKMLQRHGWWLVPAHTNAIHRSDGKSTYVYPDLRIIVLTQKRAFSLARLLKSLADAKYEQDRVDVDIWVDWIDDVLIRSGIMDTLKAFKWKFGRLNVHYRESTAGLRRQWFETWNLSIPGGLISNTRERVIILEDDVEVSPFFWTWLKEGYKQYSNREDIAGFSLQRLNLCAKFCREQNGGPVPDNINFLHPLVGSWGYSPTLRHWLNFTKWVRTYQRHESQHKPYVQGTQPTAWYKDFEKNGRCPGPNCMWTQLHHFYTSWAPDRYTVYAKCEHGLTLATNHQEKGLHYSTAMHADFPRLRTKLPEQLLNFELNPTIVGLDGKIQLKTNIRQFTNVPIVLIAMNQRIQTSMLVHTLPFMCLRNDAIVVLTNVQDNLRYASDCINIIDVSDKLQNIKSSIQFLSYVASKQQIFFIRWYILGDWMRSVNVDTVFTMDSDSVMTENITNFMHLNRHTLSKHALWIYQSLPRTTMAFAIIRKTALMDLLNFWNQILLPEIWTKEFRNDHEPNDMTAMGHYVHMRIAEPLPCWGLGPKRKNGTCEYGYNIKKILQNIRNAGIEAKYSVGNLAFDAFKTESLSAAFVDVNCRNNDAQFYKMKEARKVIRFNSGNVELAMYRNYNVDEQVSWVRHWGYILEDEYENCVLNHINFIKKKSSCICENWCCSKCQPFVQKQNSILSCAIANSNAILSQPFTSMCHNSAKDCVRVGTEYGGHEIPHPLCWLKPGDIYYGIGCGEDISFDLQLTSLYSLDMYLFDPTPRAIQHVHNVFDVIHNHTLIQEMSFARNKYKYNTGTFEISGNSNAKKWFEEVIKLPVRTRQDNFKPWALSDQDGEMDFYAPSQGVSHSLIKTDHEYTKHMHLKVTAKSLQSIMHRLGHEKVSVMKIDIEGYEILVIPYLITILKTWDRSNWPRLLLFDMDCLRPMHKQYNYSAGMNCIKMLRDVGYTIYSAHNYDYTFELIYDHDKYTTERDAQTLRIHSEISEKGATNQKVDVLANIYDSQTNTFKNGGMDAQEIQLFSNVIANVTSVFEWGMGTSTLLAYKLNIKILTAVDSSSIWVESLKAKLYQSSYIFKHVDIGPVKGWGMPVDNKFKKQWPNYSQVVNENNMPFDVYLVDGRFRVACACMALQHGHEKSLVIVHDWNRKQYHILLTLSNIVHLVHNLVVLRRKPHLNLEQLRQVWEDFKDDVD